MVPSSRSLLLAGALLLLGALPARARVDKEGLVQILSPASRVLVQPGATEVRLVLEVAFGATADGIPADPATFAAKLSGVPSAVLATLFADVRDEAGTIVGRRAEIVLPLATPRRRYQFKARVRGQGGRPNDSDTLPMTIRSNQPPSIANLRVLGAIDTGSDGSPRINPGTPVTLEASLGDGDGDAVASYEVRFGDGTVASRAAPGGTLRETHVFPADPAAGEYAVTVTAWDWATSSTQTLRLRLNAPPVAHLRLSPPQGTFRYPVYVDGLESTDPDGDPLTYAWDFGNGTTLPPSPDPLAQVVYPSIGSSATYQVRLTVRDASGLAASDVAALPVTGQYGGSTMLAIDSPHAGETVLIDQGLPIRIALDRATSGAPVDPASLQVRVNGVTATSFFGVVTDPRRGNVPVAFEGVVPRSWLRLTDGNAIAVEGNSVFFTKPGGATDRVHGDDRISGVRVTTDAMPVAALEVRPGEVFTGDPVLFDASASHDVETSVLRYGFDFGDGTPPVLDVASPTLTHAYAAEGLYRPRVTVSDGRWAVVAESQLVVRARPTSGTPRLEVDRATLDFGEVNVTPLYFYLYHAEPERLLRVRNAGTGLLHFDGVSVDGAPFAVLHGTALPDLAPGESHFVIVGFTAPKGQTTVSPGVYTSTLRLRTNGGDLDVPVVADARLAVAPEQSLVIPTYNGNRSSLMDFGPVLDASTLTWRVIANQGPVTAIVDGLEVIGDDAAFFQAGGLPGEVTAAPRDTDVGLRPPTPATSKVSVRFDPGAVQETRRMAATLLVHWRYQALPGVWTRGRDLEVGLVGLASYLGLARIAPETGGIEMERINAGQTTTMQGSAAAGRIPADVVAQYVAGRRPVDVTLAITPLFPAGHTAIALQRTSATLDPTAPLAHFPLVFQPTAPGHYSALVVATTTNAAQAPQRILVHGYARGTGAPPVLGTADTLWFVDDTSYDRSQTGEGDSALVVGVQADGTLLKRDDGLGDLGVQVDPMPATRSEVVVDQWLDEASDLVVAGGQLYAIDSDVLPVHSAGETGLTARAQTRLALEGPSGTGAIVRNRGLLLGMRTNGDPDLYAGGSVEALDMDVTPDQTVFFTEALGTAPAATTRLRWIRPVDAVQGLLAADLSVALTGFPGHEVTELRAASRGGTRYRLWLLLDDGRLYGVDVDLALPLPFGLPQALAPSSLPTEAMVLDRNGNWYTLAGDGAGRIQVFRESLDAGASSLRLVGEVVLPFADAPEAALVDASGVVLVATQQGVLRFVPQPSGALVCQGYVLSGATWIADQLRGDVVDGDDLRTAEVPVAFDRLWVGR